MNFVMTILVMTLIGAAALFILYLLMIMPRVSGKPDMTPFKKWLYAHRGLHDNASEAPENSLKAFSRAVEAGYGIELDVQMTKDRVPVVFHDFTLERVCGRKGKVSDYTYQELQKFRLCASDERIPKFEDVLRLVDARASDRGTENRKAAEHRRLQCGGQASRQVQGDVLHRILSSACRILVPQAQKRRCERAAVGRLFAAEGKVQESVLLLFGVSFVQLVGKAGLYRV